MEKVETLPNSRLRESRDLMSRSLGLENRRDFLESLVSTRLLRPLFDMNFRETVYPIEHVNFNINACFQYFAK